MNSFSHSGINECNKAGTVLPGEWASVILMELDRVTHNPPLLPELSWKKRSTLVANKRYYTDGRHEAKEVNST